MSNLRKVYFDFQDGTGFQDVSAIVKYNTFTINMSAFNDTYHYSQNTCSFDAIYNETFTSLILSTDKNIIVRIVDWSTETMLTTESNWLLTTEDAFYLIAEQGIATPVFYGQIKPTRSRSYNGILNNTILSLEATDELDLLDKEVGDIILTNCKILDPANPTASLVHILAGIAGFTNISANTTIDVTIAKFAPEKETESILTILDTLLYEYGYVLNINGYGVLEPIKWIYDAIPTQIASFDEDTIISSITIKDTVQNYDGSKIIYYELGSASKVLLYRDDNCSYNEDGTFAGYNIVAGYSYPPETNVIDETTGLPTVVYQEYTDDSIKYWTNKAIKNKLDYNYKAFSSDFSAIVATEKHFMDVKYSTGIAATTPEFYNKKCRLLYNNPTADSGLKLYYNNVYGDVWYKSAERTSTVDNVLAPDNRYEYTASYIFDKIHADVLAKTYAAQYAGHRTMYTFPSEEDVFVGTLATVVLEDGTNQLCIVQNRSWDEQSEYYNYTLMSYSVNKPALTAQTVSTTATIDPSYTYPVISTIGTPVAIANSSPAYRGIGILSSAVSVAFVGGIVNENGVIAVSTTISAYIGDWMVNYDATNLPLGIYVWDGFIWSITNDVDYISAASIDLCNLQVGGITVGGFTTFITAIVKTLFAQNIILLSGGNIRDSGYTTGVSGFNIASTGTMEMNNISARGIFTNGNRYNFLGESVDQREEGIYIGNGQEQYTSISPYYGDTNTSKWHPTGILATYTGDSYESEYLRAATIPNSGGYFVVITSANTLILYRYLLGAVTKIVTTTIPTAGTNYSSFDIVSISGNFVDGVYISILNASIIRRYSLSLAGTMTLLSTLVFPVNVNSVLSCPASTISIYSTLYVVDVLVSTSTTHTNEMRLYGYKTSDSSLTLLYTLSHPTGYDPGWQNQLLQTNYFRDEGITKSESIVLLNNFIVKIDTFTQVMTLGYYNNIYNNRCARCSIYGNGIFQFDTINDRTSITIWRGISATRFDSEEFRGLSSSTIDMPHRAIPLGYGLMACIGANFGGIKILAVAPNL